jgi:hypothetical protein
VDRDGDPPVVANGVDDGPRSASGATARVAPTCNGCGPSAEISTAGSTAGADPVRSSWESVSVS